MKLKHLLTRTGRVRFSKMLLVVGAAAFTLTSQADELQLVWQIAPGERDYIGSNHLERGVSINPVTGNVIMVSRAAGGPHVVVLDGATGAELRKLNVEGVSGGTFALNMIGVADDGVVYGANLSTSTTVPNLKVYRWENDQSQDPPVLVFEGDPALREDGTSATIQRWGDSFDVRGAGNDTQLLFGSNAGPVAAWFTTQDGGYSFQPKLITGAFTSGALSVSFGQGNSFWADKTTQQTRLVTFDPATGVATVRSFAGILNSVGLVAANPARNLLAGIDLGSPTNLKVYDISDLNTPTLVDSENFPTNNGNSNGVGSADWHNDIVAALNTNNGLVVYRVVASVTPPGIVTHPANSTILEGGYGSLSVSATGTAPLSYQWRLNGEEIPGATNSVLTLTNVTTAQGGSYDVVVSNAAGSVTSNAGTLTVNPTVQSNRATPLWHVAAGSRSYITDANTERGIAYNPKTGHLLLVSRTGEVEVRILDAATGANVGTLATPSSVVFGSNPGGFRLNMIDVADDGMIYAANLDTTGGNYTIYRWENEQAAEPTVAWIGDPGNAQRYGDTFVVRGSGVDTQILAASRFGTGVAIFTTTDGHNFAPTFINVEGAAAGNFGLGVAFGEGNTFWGKATGTANPLVRVQFDLNSGTGTILNTYNTVSSIGPIAVDTEKKLLAGISLETPDNVRLYDISNLEADPVLIDVDFFPTDNPNLNGTGSIRIKGDKIFALDTNNGILALQLNTVDPQPEAARFANVRKSGTNLVFSLQGTPNTTYRLQATEDFGSWSNVQTVTIGTSGNTEVSVPATEAYRFFRAVAP